LNSSSSPVCPAATSCGVNKLQTISITPLMRRFHY
jgi:hypothetical protein